MLALAFRSLDADSKAASSAGGKRGGGEGGNSDSSSCDVPGPVVSSGGDCSAMVLCLILVSDYAGIVDWMV